MFYFIIISYYFQFNLIVYDLMMASIDIHRNLTSTIIQNVKKKVVVFSSL